MAPKALVKSPLVPTTVSLLFIAELIAPKLHPVTDPATIGFFRYHWYGFECSLLKMRRVTVLIPVSRFINYQFATDSP